MFMPWYRTLHETPRSARTEWSVRSLQLFLLRAPSLSLVPAFALRLCRPASRRRPRPRPSTARRGGRALLSQCGGGDRGGSECRGPVSPHPPRTVPSTAALAGKQLHYPPVASVRG